MNRTYLRVKLSLDSDWRTGVWDAGSANRQGTARDAGDPSRPSLPGSSIVGSLRRVAQEQGVDIDLFGARDISTIASSPWWLLGTTMSGLQQVASRQQTSIDRWRNAATSGGLRETEYVDAAPESTLTLYFRTDGASPKELVEVLLSWRNAQVGAGETVGLGRVSVTEIRHRTLNLNDKADVLALLTTPSGGPERVDSLLRRSAVTVELPPVVQPAPLLRVEFRLDEARVPVDERLRHHGTQWKGLLRSRVEFIARSLGHPECMPEGAGSWTGCGHCDLCEAFGSAESGVGAWRFETSPWEVDAEQLIPVDGKTGHERVRVALNRFTGGTLAGALASDERTLTDIGVTLTVTQTRPVADWVTAALLHAVKDLKDGLVAATGQGGIGFGTVAEIPSAVYAREPGAEPTEVAWMQLPPVLPVWKESADA